ncbi:unnamed protein product [Caenorhabditis sp. 36 PRJEB53466]|nr:unnamed protein product [Caenorhabditis sp. 36 PRJEB53466]
MAKKPTQDELSAMIDKGMGSLLNAKDIDKRKKSGELPDNFKVEEGFGVYRIEAHKKKRKVRRAKKNGKDEDVQDDASDRDKLGPLRHVDDDEDEDDKVEGAFTPDAVLTPGIGGAIILGILVRGAGNIPQFIPNDRLTKAHKLRFDNYIEGELIIQNGKEVFVPNALGAAKMDEKTVTTVAKAAVADKVDQKMVDAIGKDMVVAVQVDVADNGMVVMKVLDEKPKDKETPVGIIVRTNDQAQFVQIAGRELGGGKDAKLMPCAIPDNAKTGDVIADIFVNAEGKAVAAKPGEVPKGAEQLGQVVVGQNDQLVFVPQGQNKDDYIKKCATMTPAMKETLEQAQCKVQAAVTGQSTDHIANQVNRIGTTDPVQPAGGPGAGGPTAAPGSSGEVRSVGFGAQQFGGSQFARPSPGGGGGGAVGGGKAGSGGGGYAGGAAAGSGEVRSVAFGGNQYGGSVYAKGASGGGYAAGSGGGGGGGGGGYAGGAAAGSGEVRSVAFGGNQYGGSVFAKGASGGGYAGGAAAKGGAAGGKSSGAYAASGGAGEVRSVGFGTNYGGSVFAKPGGGGSVPALPAKQASKTSVAKGNYGSGTEPKSVGFGVPYGGSVYMKK